MLKLLFKHGFTQAFLFFPGEFALVFKVIYFVSDVATVHFMLNYQPLYATEVIYIKK